MQKFVDSLRVCRWGNSVAEMCLKAGRGEKYAEWKQENAAV